MARVRVGWRDGDWRGGTGGSRDGAAAAGVATAHLRRILRRESGGSSQLRVNKTAALHERQLLGRPEMAVPQGYLMSTDARVFSHSMRMVQPFPV
jgi:hypothetical protein